MRYSYDIVTIGGATLDIVCSVDEAFFIENEHDPLRERLIAFEYGAKVGITNMMKYFGGGAANVAVAAARLGKKAAIITAVGGDDEGRRITRNLDRHGVDCRFVEIKKNAASGISLIIKPEAGDHILFTYRGANDSFSIDRKARKKVAKARRVYISSLTGQWRAVLEAVMSAKTKCAWNPGRKQIAAGYKILKPFLAQTDILIINKDEATELALSMKKGSKVPSIGTMLRQLVKAGPRLAVITDGKKGAQAFDGKKIYKQKATGQKAIDTTGVGDAFAATFVVAVDAGVDIQRALRAAMKNSGSVVAKPGAQNGLLSADRLQL